MRLRLTTLLAAATALVLTARAAAQDAPMAGFVDLERYEIRFEVIARLRAVVSDPDDRPIGVDDRARTLEPLRSRLSAAARILADGEPLVFSPLEIEFIQFDPELGPVPDPRESIPVADATVGASFVCARDGFPESLDIDWELFPLGEERTIEVAIQTTTVSGTSVDRLTFAPDSGSRRWEVPAIESDPGVVAMTVAERDTDVTPWLVSIAVVLLGLGLGTVALKGSRERRPGLLVTGLVAVLIGGGSLFDTMGSSAVALDDSQARDVAGGLLKNIYRGFAYRDESAIFDTLARSVDGPLLEQLYLDIRRGLNVEESGGPRVKVLSVTVVDCELQRSTRDGFRARLVWVSEGSVTHWGHVHHRRNQYRGDIAITAVDGRWKVTGVEILAEQRV